MPVTITPPCVMEAVTYPTNLTRHILLLPQLSTALSKGFQVAGVKTAGVGLS